MRLHPIIARMFGSLPWSALAIVWMLSCVATKNADGQLNANGGVATPQSRVSSTPLFGKSTRVKIDLGSPANGETLGLEGAVFGVGSETHGYNRWDIVLKNADGSILSGDLSLQLIVDIEMQESSFSVTVPIEIKSGMKESRTPFLVPFDEGSPAFSWSNREMNIRARLSQDGYSLPGLIRVVKNRVSSIARFNFDNSLFTQQHGILLMSEDVVKSHNPGDWSESITIQTDAGSSSVVSAAQVFMFDWSDLVASGEWTHPNYGLAVVDRLPTNWLEFSTRQLIVVSARDFPKLSAPQRDAILDYTLAGGRFVVTDLLTDPDSDGTLHSWIAGLVPDAPPASEINSELLTKRNTDPSFEISLGFGKIILATQELSAFQKSMFVNTERTYGVRNSNSIASSSTTDREAIDVLAWYIPRVGQPPVIGFSIFICAFAVVAGPLLLWWFHYRMRRPVLILVAVPILAFLISGFILIYSMAKDGFDTYARVRSITWVNQASARGVSYSRQTFFSGMPPSEVAFSKRSEVWPTLGQRRYYGRSNLISNIKLKWEENQQIYSGFLSPRSQCQWTVTTPLDSFKTFDYVVNPQSTELVKVQNLMQDDWIFGVFCDKKGTLKQVGSTQAGAQADLTDISPPDAFTEVSNLYKPLAFPLGFIPGQSNSIGTWLTQEYEILENSDLDSGMEAKLKLWISREQLSLPGSYLLFLKTANYLDQPLRENTRESDSFHVLAGRW